uniref:Proline-serine-threonine phosphatase interacting protein 1b n=1 Tax=Hippocampus comes TaxID=109280 RepID=A0A3Q3E8D7_HIPCM
TMTRLMFRDAFWGSDFTCHAGYEALVQRLRDGRQMCKDVEELLKMRASAEEKYGRELMTIARKAGGHAEIRTRKSIYYQNTMENMGNFHIQLSEAMKEEVKKVEAFRERQKEQRKKVRGQILRGISDNIPREGSSFPSRCFFPPSSKASWRKCRRERCQKLYLTNIDQLESIRQDWEETHRSTCEVFQQMEADRISLLRCTLWDHCNHISMQCVKDDEFFEEVRKHLEHCDITTDNNCFIEMKRTGWHPPGDFLPCTVDTDKKNIYTHIHPIENSKSKTNLTCIRTSNPLLESGTKINVDSRPSVLPSSEEGQSCAVYTLNIPVIMLVVRSIQVEDELTVQRGDVVQVLERGDDGWWTVERNGQEGIVPGNYLGKL